MNKTITIKTTILAKILITTTDVIVITKQKPTLQKNAGVIVSFADCLGAKQKR